MIGTTCGQPPMAGIGSTVKKIRPSIRGNALDSCRRLLRSRAAAIGGVLLLLAVVGLADYATGLSLSFSLFYLLPIIVAGWRVGMGFAICIAVLSVVSINVGALGTNPRIEPGFYPVWNALIQLCLYLIVVWLLMRWKGLREALEGRVRERTADLTAEIAAREELESKILIISEREQRRIGCDLHDLLCQHLAATALAAKVLEEKMAGQASAEAGNVVSMIEHGIAVARDMARGLTVLPSGKDNLLVALEDLAASTREHFNVDCQVSYGDSQLTLDEFRAIHLYRIAQEAVGNAIRHGRATRLTVTISQIGSRGILSVQDDGTGMPDQPNPSGMGLRIMRHRARMLGGQLDIYEENSKGVTISCSFPVNEQFPAPLSNRL